MSSFTVFMEQAVKHNWLDVDVHWKAEDVHVPYLPVRASGFDTANSVVGSQVLARAPLDVATDGQSCESVAPKLVAENLGALAARRMEWRYPGQIIKRGQQTRLRSEN